jgi:hypothetical protein
MPGFFLEILNSTESLYLATVACILADCVTVNLGLIRGLKPAPRCYLDDGRVTPRSSCVAESARSLGDVMESRDGAGLG